MKHIHYVITKRITKRAYYAEPYVWEGIVGVTSDYKRAVAIAFNHVTSDHALIHEKMTANTVWCRHDPKPSEFLEGKYINSISYVDGDTSIKYDYKIQSYIEE